MSMGVCITHCTLPVQYSFEIAQELLKSAKQRAYREKQTGTIDWMVIENDATGSAVLEYQRQRPDDKPGKTLRPYTWKQAAAMKKFIQTLRNEKTFAFQLSQSWYKHTKEEAGLFYEYQLFRKKDDLPDDPTAEKIRYALDSLSKGFDGITEKNNILYPEGCCSPWLDAIELWDYVGDEE